MPFLRYCGIIYKIDFDTDDNRLFIVESHRPIYTPKRYRNWFGQLLEHSPFCERDIRRPQELETNNEKAHALKKLHEKNADMIVLNSLNDPGAGFGYDTNKIVIFDNRGSEFQFETKSKKEVASDIINTIIKYSNG